MTARSTRPDQAGTPVGRSPSADNILRVAAALFAERGYAATSTRDIAAAVGIKQPTLYKHFASKDDILVALVRLAVHPLADLAAALLHVPAPADARLCRWIRDTAVHLTASPHSLGSLLISPGAVLSERLADELRRYDQLERDVTALVLAGQHEGGFAAGDPVALARITLSAFDTLALPETTVGVDDLVGYTMAALLADRGRLPAVRAAGDALELPGAGVETSS